MGSVSWPKGSLPRTRWPSSVTELAALLVDEIRKIRPSGPYQLAGHSFGATVSLEMARLLESNGEQVLLVALLDPRSLPLIETTRQASVADTLALLSENMADGRKYAEYCEQLSRLDASEHRSALQRILGSAAAET